MIYCCSSSVEYFPFTFPPFIYVCTLRIVPFAVYLSAKRLDFKLRNIFLFEIIAYPYQSAALQVIALLHYHIRQQVQYGFLRQLDLLRITCLGIQPLPDSKPRESGNSHRH